MKNNSNGMSKRTLKNKNNNVSSKYGNILSFVKPQSSSDLLKSKDGLVQGRIESFMQKKVPNGGAATERSSGSALQARKRPPSGDSVINRSCSPRGLKRPRKSLCANKVAGKTPSKSVENVRTVIDLTEVDHSLKPNIKAKQCLTAEIASISNEKSEDVNNQDCHHSDKSLKTSELDSDCENPKIIPAGVSNALAELREPNNELETNNISENADVIPFDVPEATANASMDHFDGSKESQCYPDLDKAHDSSVLSVDDLGLNDSFLNAALDGISPMKSNLSRSDVPKTTTKLLACNVPCSSDAHSLSEFRHRVLEVQESYTPSGFTFKILELENVCSKKKLVCELHDGWVNTRVMEGDVVNLILDDKTEVTAGGNVKVDAKANLIAVHPDILLSGTTISNAIGCKRRAVLNEKFKNTESGDMGKPIMLIGTIVHTLFQNMAQSRQNLTACEVLALAKNEVAKPTLLKDVLSLGTTQKEVLNGVAEFIPQLLSWTSEYVRDSPTAGVGKVDISLPPNFTHENLTRGEGRGGVKFSANAALTNVQDIEENVWSPLYGLKGKIDVTAEFMVRRQTSQGKACVTKLTLPLELKTGRESHSTEHHAQVAIYSMFCEERRKKSEGENGTIPAGLLLYLKAGNLSCIPLKRGDRRELMMIRNEVAAYMARAVLETKKDENPDAIYSTSPLPATIDSDRFCKNCSQLRNCSLLYKAVDRKLLTFSPSKEMVELMDGVSSHLQQKDLEYFEHWTTCMLLETRESMKKDLNQYHWLKSPKERSDAKLCVTGLVLAGLGKQSSDGTAILQTFKISSNGCSPQSDLCIFSENDMVVISGNEPAFIAMATGTVSNVSDVFITVVTDRNFSGYPHDMVYSIDKHEWPSMNSFNASFHNLSVVMKSSPSSDTLRDLVIRHREPLFKTKLHEVIPRSSKDEVAKMLRGLNRTQRQAIKRVLLSLDYTLVVGMPGSGKTTTIVAMVRILLLCGCRVLLTSYTHSAIDNLLIKLIKYKVKFLRLGRTSQIHPSVHRFSEEEMTKKLRTPEDLDSVYSQAKVVGCTCLAVTTHALFSSPGTETAKRSRFDVCIVDEASQISQPACLAPLLHADRFVLVGDHRQLPPLVRSRKAKSIGADESLFWRLSQHKEALCDLTLQYRMNSTIMGVSNFVTYEGRLECAADAVAMATLKLPNIKETLGCLDSIIVEFEGVNMEIAPAQWLVPALDPGKPVVFLDTSKLGVQEQEVENGICNKIEAELLKVIVDHLLQAGCLPENIGIIAPFRKQLRVIEECLCTITSMKDNKKSGTEKVEINTVDKYQGRDKSVILLSFVRCRKGELGDKKGEILSDWRRLNVALTRAKHKMVIVGCADTLVQYEPCKKLLTYLREKDMILTLF